MLDAIGHWAGAHGGRLLMRAEDAARWDGEATVVSGAELAEQAAAVVSLGGDGTMLGALRLVARRPVPVLGVNLGNLGFLVEVQPEELPDALDRLERGDFTIEERSGLWLGADGDEAVAFNDLAFVRVPGDGVVEARLSVGGMRMGRYRCDGLVISTSIGSTAYAYSAGGPLVSPALDVRLKPGCGQVVRLDRDRYERRNQVKLSLLDLPYLPDELRDIAAPGSLPSFTQR